MVSVPRGGIRLLLIAAFASCSGSGGSSGPTSPKTQPGPFTGSWKGSDSTLLTMSMTLDDPDVPPENTGSIAGSGYLSGAAVTGGQLSFGVTGKDSLSAQSSVSLTIAVTGYQPATFIGTLTFAGQEIVGVLNGSGFNQVPLTLVHQ